MKPIFILFILLLTTDLVSAVGFSPSSLIFELQPNQQECKIISLTSDSETISASDKWAEDKEVEWKVSLFDKPATYHSISINYPKELSADERQVEVCISGTEQGEYHGVMLLREEQQGNSVVQMGIWIKVIINEPVQEFVENPQESGSSPGGGSGGGGGGSSASKTITTEDNSDNLMMPLSNEISQEQNQEIQEKTDDKITGAVVEEEGNPKGKIGIIIAIVFIVIIGIIIYQRKHKIEV